jgi:hypothetical protein
MMFKELSGKEFGIEFRWQNHRQHIGFANGSEIMASETRSQVSRIFLKGFHPFWVVTHLTNTLQRSSGEGWRQGNCPNRGR